MLSPGIPEQPTDLTRSRVVYWSRIVLEHGSRRHAIRHSRRQDLALQSTSR